MWLRTIEARSRITFLWNEAVNTAATNLPDILVFWFDILFLLGKYHRFHFFHFRHFWSFRELFFEFFLHLWVGRLYQCQVFQDAIGWHERINSPTHELTNLRTPEFNRLSSSDARTTLKLTYPNASGIANARPAKANQLSIGDKMSNHAMAVARFWPLKRLLKYSGKKSDAVTPCSTL